MSYVLKNIKTPYYILDEEKLKNNFFSMKRAFESKWSNFIIGYSFKTNSLPWILDWMKVNGAYAEVVSEPEYRLAVKYGYKDVILNGPYKGWDALKEALNSGMYVNLDSFHEINWIKNNRPEDGVIWKVGLRINFDLNSYCENETVMGAEVGRFGFNLENGSFSKAIEELKELNYVKIVGLHGHNSTKTKSLKIFKTIAQKMVECKQKIKNDIQYIDMGGCIFGDKPGAPTFDEYAEVITSILKNGYDERTTTLIMEPGAALIASPIKYVCSVIDVKKVKEQYVVSTDGSLLHIDPQMHGIKFQLNFGDNDNRRILDRQIICGYTCIEKDRLSVLNGEKELLVNDRILIDNTGAYSMALSPLFIQYYPSVVVKSGKKYFYARKPWSVEEYTSNCYVGYDIKVEE